MSPYLDRIFAWDVISWLLALAVSCLLAAFTMANFNAAKKWVLVCAGIPMLRGIWWAVQTTRTPSFRLVVLAGWFVLISAATLWAFRRIERQENIERQRRSSSMVALPAPRRFLPWLRLYLKFYAVAWNELKQSWKRSPQSPWLFGASFVSIIGLLFILRYEFGLASGRAWIIVVLSLLIAFLACVVELLRRYHERTVNQRVLIARRLIWYVGAMSEHLASLPLEIKSDKEFLESWLNGIEESIKMCFGPDDRPDAFRKLRDCTKPLSDHIDAQVMWANKYVANLNFIIDEQAIPIGPTRQSRKERKMLEQADAQTRAWAAKQNDKSNRS